MAQTSHTELKIGLASAFVALTASLVQNLWLAPSGTTLVFDSGHYLGTTALLTQLIISKLHLANALVTGFSAEDAKKLGDYLLLDGPLVPVVGALFFAAHNTLPQAGHYHVFIVLESLFHALAAGMCASLIYKMCRRQWLALVGGLSWALYPAAILGCDSFLGEVPATALMLVFMRLLAASLDGKSKLKLFLAGVCGATVFMSKPALVFALVAMAMLAFVFWFKREPDNIADSSTRLSRLSWAVPLIAGAMITLAPWLAFTKYSSGKWHLSAYRIPVYNIARGSSYDAEGWGTVPLDPTMQSFGEGQSALSCLLTIWRDKPLQSVNLALRKPERMWLAPWNDYHHKCFGAPSSLQIIAHQFLLALAAAGLIMLPLTLPRLDRSGQLIALSAPLTVLAHLAYVPFESSSRYGFSAAPALFVLSAIALFYCVQCKRITHLVIFALLALSVIMANRLDLFAFIHTYVTDCGWAALADSALRSGMIMLPIYIAWRSAKASAYCKRIGLIYSGSLVAAALTASALTIQLAHFTYEREQRVWRCKLTPGQSIERTFDYRQNHLENKQGEKSTALLVVECDWTNTNNQLPDNIELNGKPLTGPFFNPASLIECWSDLGKMQNEFASLFLRSPASIRHYLAVRLPSGILANGTNVIRLTAREHPVTIYGYTNKVDGRPPELPAFDYLSAGKLLNEQENTDGRVVTGTFAAAPSTCTLLSDDSKIEKGDLSPAPGRQSGTYAIFVVTCNDDFFKRTYLNKAARARSY